MARELGNALPDFLSELLSGRDLTARTGQAILIATTDAEPWPHLVLMSYGDPHLARLEAGVEAVLADRAREDLEPGTCVTGGILCDPGRPTEKALQRWRAVADGLRREA